jgi:hypothetical protein
MSKLSKYSSKNVAEINNHYVNVVENFMGGNSFTVSPLQALRIVAASSIFGEPQYYREGIEKPKTISNLSTLLKYDIFNELVKDKRSAIDVFTSVIDTALDYDFKGTLDLAVELRNEYYMRLNPAVIFVRATEHSGRAEFISANPGYMKKIAKAIALRPDDVTNQFDYYMFLKGSKKGLSSILKRSWANTLESFSRYHLNKYKGKKLIDLIRISHANNEDINELMKTGTLKVNQSEKTWENLRSERKTWGEIINTIKIPHMALLRNLRGIFTEVNDIALAKIIVEQLKAGVLAGKQFPFRYWSAYKAIKVVDINHKQLILDSLEECMDISIANTTKLKGRVASLCDNSGSAWGTTNSEYGTVTVAEIANMSALITGMQADEGHVGIFGDRLEMKSVSKRNGLMNQLEESNMIGTRIGQSTENGVWLFWENAIKQKEHWDTVFIYSDMQCGTGELYGINACDYTDFTCNNGRNIDVLKLVNHYRKTVNPKINIFTVQVAGYDNTVLPANLYRGAILSGWTGRESIFAKSIIDTWNQIESNGNKTV